jgi:hypothetical protein
MAMLETAWSPVPGVAGVDYRFYDDAVNARGEAVARFRLDHETPETFFAAVATLAALMGFAAPVYADVANRLEHAEDKLRWTFGPR